MKAEEQDDDARGDSNAEQFGALSPAWEFGILVLAFLYCNRFVQSQLGMWEEH